TLAAALGLGGDARRAEQMERQLDAAAALRNSAAQRSALERALADAQRVLGDARRAKGKASPEEAASLLALAREYGLSPERAADGIAIGLQGVLASGSAALTPSGTRAFAGLAALARAHPYGAIRIEALAAPGAPDGEQR